MKEIILLVALIAATGTMTNASTQLTKSMIFYRDGGRQSRPIPSKCPRTHRRQITQVSYDPSTENLTVSIPTNAPNGLIEIQSSTSGTNTITIASGTTMFVNMNNYDGDTLTIIVSCGDTIIFYDIIDNR